MPINALKYNAKKETSTINKILFGFFDNYEIFNFVKYM